MSNGEFHYCEHGYSDNERCPDCDVPEYLPRVLPAVFSADGELDPDVTLREIMRETALATLDFCEGLEVLELDFGTEFH